MADTNSIALAASGVTKRYGSVEALRGVDMEVQAGEIVGMLGPNGAGKTTFVEILSGLRVRDHGSVAVLGVDPQDANGAWRSRIGAVLQLGAESDELKAGEVLRAHAAYYPAARDVAGVAEDLGLSDLMDRKVSKLSGGQRRRLDIAVGVIGDPELLFLDEPTTGLDPEVRRRIWDFVRRLADGGTTIVLTTHYLDEVEQLADRVLVIVDGEVVTRGTTAEIIGTATTSTVTFRLGSGESDGLPTLPGTRIPNTNGRISFETDDSTRFVAELMNWAGSDELIHDLEVSKPNLEETYLNLLETASSIGEEV